MTQKRRLPNSSAKEELHVARRLAFCRRKVLSPPPIGLRSKSTPLNATGFAAQNLPPAIVRSGRPACPCQVKDSRSAGPVARLLPPRPSRELPQSRLWDAVVAAQSRNADYSGRRVDCQATICQRPPLLA